MKKGNNFLIYFTLFLMIFQTSILSYHYFTSNIISGKALTSSIKTPLSITENNLDNIEMNYNITYEIVKNGLENKDTIPILLSINGTNDLYENGTISYYIGKNITDEIVLDLLSEVFIENQIDFFQNHGIEESFQTFFSYRREAMSNNLSEFLTNASYTIFWLNNSGNEAGYLKESKSVKFLDVDSPRRLSIFDENRTITENTWSDEKSELSKNVRVLNSFYLKADLNSETIINLYFDKTWTILLRGKIEIYDSNDDKYILEIKLVDTNLDLDFLPDNPFWRKRLSLFIIIPLTSVASIIIVYMLIKKSRIQKKEDILDKI